MNTVTALSGVTELDRKMLAKERVREREREWARAKEIEKKKLTDLNK